MAKTTITNKEVLEISQALGYLNGKETQAWYAVGKNVRKIKPLLEEIEASKQSLFEKYAAKDEDGQIKFLDKQRTQIDFGENQEEANETWKKIQDERVEVDFYTFKHGAIAEEKLNSNAIIPLIDIIIVD